MLIAYVVISIFVFLIMYYISEWNQYAFFVCLLAAIFWPIVIPVLAIIIFVFYRRNKALKKKAEEDIGYGRNADDCDE